MKSIHVLAAVIMILAAGIYAQAQSGKPSSQLKTETFKVWGKCDMCKDRIEAAAKAEGASSAAWIEKTQLLTVTFDPAKTNKDALCRKLASVGHDTEKYKAPDAVYEKLPGCCHYDRAK